MSRRALTLDVFRSAMRFVAIGVARGGYLCFTYRNGIDRCGGLCCRLTAHLLAGNDLYGSPGAQLGIAGRDHNERIALEETREVAGPLTAGGDDPRLAVAPVDRGAQVVGACLEGAYGCSQARSLTRRFVGTTHGTQHRTCKPKKTHEGRDGVAGHAKHRSAMNTPEA